MALVGFQYEPVSLDINEVCFEEEQDIPDTREKSRKSQSVTEWYRCGKWDIMHTNFEYLSCGEVEASEYFQLSDMRFDDRNMVSERVSTIVLKLYLTWTPAQILEHIIEFQNRIWDSRDSQNGVLRWRPQTNNTKKTFILNVAMVLNTSLWNNY